MKKLVIAIVASCAISGCATQTFDLQPGAGEKPDQEDMQSFWISGVGQQKIVNAAEVCGGMDKVAKVESHMTFLDGFLGGITYGIYTPRTARVYCLTTSRTTDEKPGI
jgi:hypothetical protein